MMQTIPLDLYNQGYKSQTCVDFSTIVVDMMKRRHYDAIRSISTSSTSKILPRSNDTPILDNHHDINSIKIANVRDLRYTNSTTHRYDSPRRERQG